MLSELPFVKYEGLGNDFVLLDNRASAQPLVTLEEATRICDRHFGVGADGVIFLLPSPVADFGMRIFNNDGSEAEMCGNGIRCLAHFARSLGIEAAHGSYRVETPAGVLPIELLEDGQVRVDMGPPYLSAAEIPTTLALGSEKVVAVPITVDGVSFEVTCVNMGNPHAVVFVPDSGAVALERFGPRFEHHENFPARINTHFVQVLSRTHLRMRVWERGAGPTLACGTGACAVLVAAVLNGLSEPEATVELPGGPLAIRWDAQTNRLLMTGPARRVFAGVL